MVSSFVIQGFKMTLRNLQDFYQIFPRDKAGASPRDETPALSHTGVPKPEPGNRNEGAGN